MALQSGLEGMRVLITGASGGIGDACAAAFAAEGSELLLHAGSRVQALEARARAWPGARVVGADLRDAAQIDALIDRGVEALGGVDIAIVNAGIWPAEDLLLHETSLERIEEVLRINLLGAMLTCRAFMRALARRGPREDGRGASICFVGSTAGRFGEAGHSAYAVSKAGMYGLVRTLKNEIVRLDPYARVNMVEPGWTATPMAEAALEREGVIAKVVRTMPLRQIARAEDIARAVLTLSAPQLSRHISGEVITVAGGMEGRVQWGPEDVDEAAVRERLRRD